MVRQLSAKQFYAGSNPVGHSKKNIMDKETELMVITMEECGEMIQACSKVLRTNYEEHALIDLTKEIGDVMCMIDLIVQNNYIDENDIKICARKKREKLKTWSNLIERI